MVDGSPTVLSRFRTRLPAVAAALCVVAGSLLATASPATADTVPVNPTEPASVSSDILPTAQINGVVWSQAIVGDTVFAGGGFTSARPAGSPLGQNEVPRNNFVAYSISTGVMTSFAPSFNGQVLAVAASPDGSRLYAAGEFTAVDGKTRSRLAVFDTATGALLPVAPVFNTRVRALAVTATTVYAGGDFTAVAGQARTGVAALSLDGTVSSWAPQLVGAGVSALAVSPDGQRIAIGGRFTSANGSNKPGYGLALIAAAGSGTTNLPLPANTTLRTAGANAGITSLAVKGDSFYLTAYTFGSGGNFEGTARVKWDTGAIVWVEDCHGDSYSVYPSATLVYKSSHSHDCRTVPGGFADVGTRWHSTAFTDDVRGTLTKTPNRNYTSFAGQPAPALVDWFPQWLGGTYTSANQATWNVTGNDSYVVYGGEFIGVNNKPQQGLVRFAVPSIAPNKDGPRLSGDATKPTLSIPTVNQVKLSWKASYDRDNEKLSYQIVRDGAVVGETSAKSRWYSLPTVTFTDTGLNGGQSYSYVIRAVDPYGNKADSTAVSITATGAANAAPVSSFTTSAADLAVAFDGRGSSDPDGTVASWAWDFGDGTSATGATATHSYAAAGSYTVSLRVTDNRGAATSSTQQLVVSVTPPPSSVIAADDFSRSSVEGWGTSTSGAAWTTSGAAASYGVDGTAGTITSTVAGGTLRATMGGVFTSSADVAMTTSVGQAVTGGSQFISIVGRKVGSADYSATATIATSGVVTAKITQTGATVASGALPGVTFTPGTPLSMRFQVDGTGTTSLKAKVWMTGSPEPEAWSLVATDTTAALQSAGNVGVTVYLGSASTGLPRVTTFDDFTVRAVG